jgi:xanthine dehydrogenase accessory factor
MRDILTDLDRWQTQRQTAALATVVQTWGSSPRQPGARLALTPEGQLTGSVSGGCVEGAVFEEGVQAIRTGQARLVHFGVADETAWEVGLACGGSLDVFVQPLDWDWYAAQRAALQAEEPFANATLVRGPAAELGQTLLLTAEGVAWSSLGPARQAEVLPAARAALSAGRTGVVPVGEAQVFVEVVLPPPTLVAVGGVHITLALVDLARTLGYRTVVVDPRAAFGSQERFPPDRVDRLISAWPDEALAQLKLTPSTAVAMLTHDPKLDDPALLVALPSPAFYVGALGSQTTQARRRERLLAQGLTPAQLARLHGPIGLDLGGRTPEEIALSILAEIVRARNRAEGERQPAPGAQTVPGQS